MDDLKLAIRITDRFSFKTIDEIVVWARKLFNPEEMTFASHALKEPAFLDHSARFIVYGHTHHHEIVPLDSIPDHASSHQPDVSQFRHMAHLFRPGDQ